MVESITNNPDIPKCKFLGCEQPQKLQWKQYVAYCEYHENGGAFGSGESYEQYQIIEQDFIDFIKAVPLRISWFVPYAL